jgi:hypothetical protein
MAGLRFLEGPGEILVALQAGFTNRPFEKPLFTRFVGIVAPGAFADRGGPMQILPLEGAGVMTAEAEFRLVGTDVQQETVGSAMGLVAAGAVPLPVGGVADLLLPPGVVALTAERSPLGLQLEAGTTLDGMLLDLLLMTVTAVAFFYRLMG